MRLFARLIAAIQCIRYLKNMLFSLCADYLALYKLWSSRTENNFQYFSRPGSSYRCHPSNTFVLGGPSPRRGNASGLRRTLEAQRLSAHVARWARTAAPRPWSTPLTSTRSFVSRRCKSRGDPRSRTGLQCGQAIARSVH